MSTNTIRVTKSVTGKKFAEAIARILSAKVEFTCEMDESGNVKGITLKNGVEELEIRSNYGMEIRNTIHEDEIRYKVVFQETAAEKASKLGIAIERIFEQPASFDDAKAYGETICDTLSVYSYNRFKIFKEVVKPNANGGELVESKEIIADDMPF